MPPRRKDQGPEFSRAVTNETLALDALVANPRNPKRHPPEQLKRLAASIREFGQPRPILVRKENHMIIAGHGVWEACANAGLTEVDCRIWDVDQRTADAFMVGDNQLATLGRDDTDQIRELLIEFGMEDPESIGFSVEDVDKLINAVVDDIEVVEIDTATVDDRFWISVRGPLKDQATALARLQEAMKDLSDVQVDLGTIADG